MGHYFITKKFQYGAVALPKSTGTLGLWNTCTFPAITFKNLQQEPVFFFFFILLRWYDDEVHAAVMHGYTANNLSDLRWTSDQGGNADSFWLLEAFCSVKSGSSCLGDVDVFI